MKLIELKTTKELKLPGIGVEFVFEGTKLTSMILRPEGEEDSYEIRKGESYSDAIKVFRRQMFETKEVFRLSGTFMGAAISQDFDDESEAKRKLADLGNLPLDHSACDLTITPVKIRVDEGGAPISRARIDDDVPF